MGKKRERKLTDEEVALLNKLVEAGVRILRNKNMDVSHPEFQDEKKSAIEEIFKANGIISKDQKDRLWPSLAARIQLTMEIPPEEHFAQKRRRELKKSLLQPDDARTRELLAMARELLPRPSKKQPITATMIRDAVYKAIALIRYSTKRQKEEEANLLKYYLCTENKIPTFDPDLKSLSHPDRQKDLFVT